MIEGPNNLYRFDGYSALSVKAHFNSIYVQVTGFKRIRFQDGTEIVYNNLDDNF